MLAFFAHIPSCCHILFRVGPCGGIIVLCVVYFVGAGLAGMPAGNIPSTCAAHILVVEIFCCVGVCRALCLCRRRRMMIVLVAFGPA